MKDVIKASVLERTAFPDQSVWLIGPIEEQALDTLILACFEQNSAIHFFKQSDNLSQLLESLQHAEKQILLLLIEPFKRLLPKACWQSAQAFKIPLIGLCSKSLPPVPEGLLKALSGLIALDHVWTEALPEGLLLSSQPVWAFAVSSQTQPDRLFDKVYVSDQLWSENFSLYAQNQLDYFIRVNPSRLGFYLQRSSLVLMDSALSGLHFQALAAGACLLLPKGSQAARELESYFEPESEFALYEPLYEPEQLAPLLGFLLSSEHLPRPAAERLQAQSLGQSLPKAMAEIAACVLKPAVMADTGLIEALQLSGLSQPQALWQLRPVLESLADRAEKLYLELCFYLKLFQSPYSQVKPEQLWAIFYQKLSLLPASLNKELIQFFAWILAGSTLDLTKALQLSVALLKQIAEFEDPGQLFAQPAAWQQEPLLLELLSRFAQPQALRLWLSYQQALCQARLQQFASARQSLEALLSQQYVEAAVRLWLALPDLPQLSESSAQAAAWLAQHPQNLELALYCLQAQAQQDPEAALATCLEYLALCRHDFSHSQELEKFLALYRQLQARLHPELQAAGSQILWEGPLYAYSSLASINRRWILKLLDEGYLIRHIPFEAPELPGLPQTETLNQALSQPVELYITHRWPPRSQAPSAGKWISIIPWEFGVLPQSWVQQLNAELDCIWVPSGFVAHSFEISGVSPELLKVIPNGMDAQLLKPAGPVMTLPTTKSFKFLFVGGMLERKGLDILLNAYVQAFEPDDDVTLVIKGFGSQSHYALSPLERRLHELQADPQAPEILYLEQDLSPEALASLYRACDVYVHPYRGEGFGMPILEAMACGLPVVIPNAGPAPEFCPPEASRQVYTRLRFEASRDVQGLGQALSHPYYSEVDLEQLASSLIQIRANPLERQQRAQAAAQAALAYDWQVLYTQLQAEIQRLSQQPYPRRQQSMHRTQFLEGLKLQPADSHQIMVALERDPGLAAGLLTQLSPDLLRPVLPSLLRQPLPVASLREAFAKFPEARLPVRIYWPSESVPAWPGPKPQSNWISLLPEASNQQLSLGFRSGSADIIWLRERSLPQDLKPQHPKQEIWYSHPAQQAELVDRGFGSEQLFFMPLALDFQRFHPDAAAIPQPETEQCFVFCSIFDWQEDAGWQELLSAYFQAFAEQDRVSLVLKAYGQDFEQMADELMSWIENAGYDPEKIPGLSLIQEDLDPTTLPGFYREADCFVAAHGVSGIWHLAAQACGLPVISQGHFPFLERPFSEVYQAGDTEHLAWLLRQHQQKPNLLQGPAVRAYLEPFYSLKSWLPKAEARLLSSYLLKL